MVANHKYINLETYRKDGRGVDTPVWFAVANSKIYVVTGADSGKVKRLKNNKNVRVMPCGSRGQPKGQWISGLGEFCSAEELKYALELRKKKYGLQAKLIGLFAQSRGELAGISITLE